MSSEQATILPQLFNDDLQQFTSPLKTDFTLTQGLSGKVVEVDLSIGVMQVRVGPLIAGQWHQVLVVNQNSQTPNNLSFVGSTTSPTTIMLNDGDQFFPLSTGFKTVAAPPVGACYWCICDGIRWFIRGPGRTTFVNSSTGTTVLDESNMTQLHRINTGSTATTITFPPAFRGGRFDILIGTVGSNNQVTFASTVPNQITPITVSTAGVSTSSTVNVAPGLLFRAFSDGSTWYIYGLARN